MPRRSDRPQVNILMEPELLDELDEFRFAFRFPSRAAAVKYLLATRLQQKPEPSREERAPYSRMSA